ncbi:Metallo-peptidase family M12-domain-containing protein [Jimgerdemannia flammicorona]|uniref:Disintegrin and metalloproteinase domain-containing protein B n=1 Tax=Jimgerdemannia flammicorona TaxID=994334 RepID=A0A433PWR9_9FUNG|nr:Metallo-peptidase family M12-domain-containing protein [Jimgerdemannia flammicorona]
MGAAADCTYTSSYGSIEAARIQIINDWNTASAVYERTFNVSLGLINLNMMAMNCPTNMANLTSTNTTWNQNCSDAYTINNRLSDFSVWRGGRGDDGAGLWHLMTKCFTGVKVGIAWLGMLCQTQATVQQDSDGLTEYVSGTGVSSITRDEWKVVAHEIGHGFGAIHDCTSQLCPCLTADCGCCPLSAKQCDAGGTYIMNPTSNVSTNDFSPCSITDICHAFPTSGFCLQPPGTREVETLSMCGNGIKETGEDCDPGGTDDACCYAKTCKFKPGAQCSDYNDECCSSCAIRPATTVCRPSQSSCDLVEYCNGTSPSCPPDAHLADGTACENGQKCASGQCTSRDAQCQLRGSRLNVVQHCSFQQSSCQISCADPTDSTGTHCLMLSGNFLDGTDCGFGGTCQKGVCQSAGIVNAATSWLDQNKQIAIPVGIAIGLLILLGILRIACVCCCSERRRAAKQKVSRPPSSNLPRTHANVSRAHANNYALAGYSSVPPRDPDGWVDPAIYNGNTGGGPVPPLPAYSPPRHDHASDASNLTPASSGYPGDSWNTAGRHSDNSYLLNASTPGRPSPPSRTIHAGAISSANTTPARRNNTAAYGGSDNSDQWLSGTTYESSLPVSSSPARSAGRNGSRSGRRV